MVCPCSIHLVLHFGVHATEVMSKGGNTGQVSLMWSSLYLEYSKCSQSLVSRFSHSPKLN